MAFGRDGLGYGCGYSKTVFDSINAGLVKMYSDFYLWVTSYLGRTVQIHMYIQEIRTYNGS